MTELVAGFIPLVDCASLVVARECGFAATEGIELTLVRETSWANIRDRLVIGHFDAAHVLGPMTVASTLGIGHIKIPLIAPFALGLGGNAVTFSAGLWEELSGEGEASAGRPAAGPAWTQQQWSARIFEIGRALSRVIDRRAARGLAPLTFAVVYPFSCHNYELRYWLSAVGIDPDRDVRLVVIPPPLLVDSMRAGHVDGFCVGEPWSSVAVDAGVGRIAFPTTAVWRLGPEKVLGCRADWADRNAGELSALLRALYRAADWCGDGTNHDELAGLLSDPRYVGAPPAVLRRAISGVLPLSNDGAPPAVIPEFFVPFAGAATFPWISHALWFYSQMVRWKQAPWSEAAAAAARGAYRPDLYRLALAPLGVELPFADEKLEGALLASSKSERGLEPSAFFDGRVFDCADIASYAAALPTGAPR